MNENDLEKAEEKDFNEAVEELCEKEVEEILDERTDEQFAEDILTQAVEGLSEDAQEEQAEDISTETSKEVEDIAKFAEELRKLEEELVLQKRLHSQQMFHQPTSAHSNKNRGVGVTRRNREETKAAKKLAKRQRLANRKISSKKSRPTGSKRRK